MDTILAAVGLAFALVSLGFAIRALVLVYRAEAMAKAGLLASH